MRGMEMKVMKGGKPGMDDDSMLEEAIREVARRIDGFDTGRIMGAYRAKMHPSEEVGEGADMTDGPPLMSKEECEDCAKGECTNPEHMDEDTLKQMLSGMGEKE